jgi:hypothetical protein
MYNNLFFITLIISFLFAFGGSCLFQLIRWGQLRNVVDKPIFSSRRLAAIILASICLVPAVIGLVLAFYADYVIRGSIFNRWALAFITGLILMTLFYSTSLNLASWFNKRKRKEQ